ncbi:MAG: magnesium transporter [Rhodospirillaceae bacterium]
MTPTAQLTKRYIRDTAAQHMVTGIPRAHPNTPVKDVIATLQGEHFECADTVFVTDAHGGLEGIVRINDLLAAGNGGGGTPAIGEIMEPEHEAVRPEDDQEQIAVLAMQLNMIAVPVVDAQGVLIGAVPPEALFKILRHEHMEDLQRVAGIMTHDDGPAVAIDASLLDRAKRRLPWLIFGLLASSVITLLMSGFEHTLEANVAVAFFIPSLVYIAGAIGTQAVSVAVRGLATEGLPIGRLLREELVIGITIGAALGCIAYVGVMLSFDNAPLALAVGLSVLGGGALSAVVGFGLPWVFQKFGTDPALGSGPMCTIIQDVGSLTVYFLLVTALVI